MEDSQGSFFMPEINSDALACFEYIESILGFELSISDKQPFLLFHDFITNPEPDFLAAWKNDLKSETWYHRFINDMLGHVQNAYACVLNHQNRLIELEQTVISGVEKFNYRKTIGKNSAIGGGNTLKFDFEYQAYILAFRRCLDYFARAIGSYFKNNFNSFRKLTSDLSKINHKSPTDSLVKVIEKYYPLFEFVLSNGDRKSVRDIISHYEFVKAGTINLSHRGISIVGGGKDFIIYGDGNILLSELLSTQVLNLRLCLREVINKYIQIIKSDHRD